MDLPRSLAVGFLTLLMLVSGAVVTLAAQTEEPDPAPEEALNGQARVELKDGAAISAHILGEREDTLFLDLGYTLLSIPRQQVRSVVRETSTSGQAAMSAQLQTDLFYELPDPEESTVRAIARDVGGAVVLIRTPVGLGSGFLVHPEGYIVTNHHVVAGEHRISVTAFSQSREGVSSLRREEYENVRIIALSPFLDLALLKIEDAPHTFPTVPLGRSVELNQGQTVFAIGNPLGLERSVSEGIVSLRNRPINGRLFIQTTTEINPGNSGGPLLNLFGEVVGVNNMKIAAFGTEGLAFAIPVEELKWFLNNRDAFAFDARNPNTGFRYNVPPSSFVNDPNDENNAQ